MNIEQLEDGKKLKVTLEGGEIYEGDPLEVTRKLAEGKETTNKWGKQLKTENDDLKTKHTPPPVVTPNAEEAQLQKYLLDQHAKALGFNSAEEYKAELSDVRSVKDRQKNQAVAADFMQMCPDFPNDQKSIDALTEKVKELGYDWRPQDLVAAHLLCSRENKYKPLTAEEQNQTWANNMSQASRGGAPPMLRSNSTESQAPTDLYAEPLNDQRARIIREQLAERGR